MSQQKLIHIRLPVELEQTLKAQATERGLSFPAVVRMVLTDYVSGRLSYQQQNNNIGDILT